MEYLIHGLVLILCLGLAPPCCGYLEKPIREGWGAEVYGIHLLPWNKSDREVEILRELVQKWSLVVFKHQGRIKGQRQREVTEYYGDVAALFESHDKAGDPAVLRIANDPAHGITGIGAENWHMDGVFLDKLYSHSLYHIVRPSQNGTTDFVSVEEFLQDVPDKMLAEWESLYIRTDIKKTYGMRVKDDDDNSVPTRTPEHPLLHRHPKTGKWVFCFNQDIITAFGEETASGSKKWFDKTDTKRIMKEIVKEIEKDDRKHVYSHLWEAGDFIITNNYALLHGASAETKAPANETGLRILHRTSVMGDYVPKKGLYKEPEEKDEL